MNLRGRLLSQSTAIFGVRIFGAGLIFLAQAAMARFWGGEILGEYLLVIATVNLVAVVMPLGFHTVGTFFAAEYRARGQGHLLWRFVVRSYGQVALMAGVFMILAGSLARFLPPEMQFASGLWLPVSMMALGTGVIFLNSSILVGLKRPFAGFFADGLFRPMLVVAIVAGVILAGRDGEELSTAIWSLSFGYVLVAGVQFALVVRGVRRLPGTPEPQPQESRRWWRYAMPWMLISLATDFLFDIDLILLSGLLDKPSLAVFGVCARIFALMAFGVTAVYAVSLPDIFESEANSDREEFHRKVGDANMVAAGLATVMFAGMALFGPLILMLFGPDFAVGAGPLAILCLVLVVRSVFGPASLVLSIHERPWASLPAIVGGIGVLAVANLVLVPVMDLMGAALAALIAISVWSGALWLIARNTVGIDVSIFPRLAAFTQSKLSRIAP